MRCVMEDIFLTIYEFYAGIWDLFNRTVLPVAGDVVTLGGLLFAMIVVSLIISVFWKGARTT